MYVSSKTFPTYPKKQQSHQAPLVHHMIFETSRLLALTNGVLLRNPIRWRDHRVVSNEIEAGAKLSTSVAAKWHVGLEGKLGSSAYA
jgi:hypothetical protein